MKVMNNEEIKKTEQDLRTVIRKKVIYLERYNYNQKEFTSTDMVRKIKSIIENEVNHNDNK